MRTERKQLIQSRKFPEIPTDFSNKIRWLTEKFYFNFLEFESERHPANPSVN